MTETLYYQDSRANKVYVATLDNNRVTFSWGRRGATMQVKQVELTEPGAALALYRSKLAEKRAKGYVTGEPVTPLETTVSPENGSSDLKSVSGQRRSFGPGAENSIGSTFSGPGEKCSRAGDEIPRPMLLNEIGDAELLELAPDPDWLFQIKYDGDRILLVKRGASLTSYSRSGRQTSALPKTIVQAAMACPDQDFIIDGEILGNTVWAFDILRTGAPDGGDVREEPYSKRLTRLYMLFPGTSGIRVVETATDADAKLEMFIRARETGEEGITLKRASAPYVAGRPNSGGNVLKYKFVATCSVIVARNNVKGKRSVDMVLADGTELGSVSIPTNKEAAFFFRDCDSDPW